jgi:biopolymer transport protein ExbD
VFNLLKFASSYACRSNQFRLRISLVTCLVLIFTSTLVQSSHIFAQSDPSISSNTCSMLPVKGITASGADPLQPPSHAIDQNVSTRWSNLGLGSWIQIDLGQENVVCSVGINWHRGNERINSFVISISKDGKTYTNVYSGKSDGASLTEQNYDFQSNTGRFIRVMVNGNTQNDYASIAEIRAQVSSSGQSQVQCVDGHIQNANTSGSQAGFPGTNVLDDNVDTRWSNNGVGSWIQLDLGTSSNICDINIAWYKGNERQYDFVISASNDGTKFANVSRSTNSSGSTLNLEKYNIADTNARYIRITVNGNTQNSYASITEISINVISSSVSTNYYIGAAGDWGTERNDNWKKTAQLMINNKVDLVLGLGDYSYESSKEFQPVVDELKEAGIPMKGAKGDHDSNSYAKLFGQPSMVHAFDAGPARIIMLDSYKSASSNAAFLEKELVATKKLWKIVITTTPLYTSPSKHGVDDEQTDILQPLLDKYKVDLAMWGDNHNYERIKLPNKETVYIQSGTAGRSHYEFDGQIEESIYQNDNDYGITKLAINNNSLSGQFISHSGKILDNFSIRK